MPGYQQMVQAMQKMQREYDKASKKIDESTFTYTANGVIKISMKGTLDIESIEILDDSIIDKDDIEMLTETFKLAFNGCKEQIVKARDELDAQFKSKVGPGLF